MRIPYPRTLSTRACWMARPSAPTSAKPAVMTTKALTPRAAHASTAPKTASRGTTMIARSTGSGRSRTLGYARIEPTTEAFGFTG